jgi:hypothetical protein
MKNLTQAYRAAQKRQNDGSYHDNEDSGIGVSDLDEESEDHHHHQELPSVSPIQYSSMNPNPYTVGYPSQQPQPQQQRVPSIQSMLHPLPQHTMQYAPHGMYGPPQ